MEDLENHPILYPTGHMVTRITKQRLNLQPTSSKAVPTFQRNLEEALDVRRASHNFFAITQNSWRTNNAVDFCSGNILSIATSSERRDEFLAEFARHPDFSTGSSGVRLMDGDYSYLRQAEDDMAAFHGAETALLLGSAFEANIAVWSAIPRPGDVILHDALVHASTHEGMKQSMAMDKVEFAHNDTDDFRRALAAIIDSKPLVKQGKRSILVAVESIYSMDGDVCPLQELVDIANEFGGVHAPGNIQFVVDEAHSVGVIGPNGGGLVCELGLQKDIAIVVHSFGKAIGATGAIVLGSDVVKHTIVNFGRSFIYTTSPSFPFVAAIKSAYTLLAAGRVQQSQDTIQNLARLFFEHLTSHDLWEDAKEDNYLAVPLAEDWEDRPFLTHIITISTPRNSVWWLYFHLLAESFCVFPVEHPVVPVGKSRLRVILHAFNTEDQVRNMVDAVFAWVEEVMEIEQDPSGAGATKAARDVHAWMRREGLTGYGLS